MQSAKLTAQPREGRGKNAARELRRQGRIPAVLYGHGDASQELSLDAHDLSVLLASVAIENTLIDLAIGDAASTKALVREVQRHPYRREYYHVDLLHVHAGEKLHLNIPIHLSGTPAGMRDGGIVDQVLYELHVECLPGDIPDTVEIDISPLGIGDTIRVSDINLTSSVKILNDGELPIVSLAPPTVIRAEDETPSAAPAAEAGGAAAADAEEA